MPNEIEVARLVASIALDSKELEEGAVNTSNAIDNIRLILQDLGVDSTKAENIIKKCFADTSKVENYLQKLEAVSLKTEKYQYELQKLQEKEKEAKKFWDEMNQAAGKNNNPYISQYSAQIEEVNQKLEVQQNRYDQIQSALDDYVKKAVTNYDNLIQKEEAATQKQLGFNKAMGDKQTRTDALETFSLAANSLHNLNDVLPGASSNINSIIYNVRALKQAMSAGASTTIFWGQLIVAAASTAVLAIQKAFEEYFQAQDEKTEKRREVLKAITDEAAEYTESLRDLQSEQEKNKAKSDGEAEMLLVLKSEYDELRNKTELTVSEKEKLDSIAEKLAKSLDTTTDALKTQSGAYRDLTEDVDKYIEALIRQAKYEGFESIIKEAANSVSQLTPVVKKAEEEYEESQKKFTEKFGEDFETFRQNVGNLGIAFEGVLGTALPDSLVQLYQKTENLRKRYVHLSAELNSANAALENATEGFKNLGKETEDNSEIVNKKIDDIKNRIGFLNDKIETSTERLKELNAACEKNENKINSLKISLSDLSGYYDKLNQGQTLDYDTLLSLIDKYPEYASQLSGAADNADLQKKAIKALFEAKRNEYILTQQSAVENIRASNEETKTLIENTQKQLEAKKELLEAMSISNFKQNVLERQEIRLAIYTLEDKIKELKETQKNAQDQIGSYEEKIRLAKNLSIDSFKLNNSSSSKNSKNKNTPTYTTSGRGVNGVEGNSYAQSRIKWIERVRNLEKMTLSEEINELEALKRRTDLTYEEMYDIDLKLYKDRQKLLEENTASRESALQAEYDRIDKLAKRKLISAREEIRQLENVAKKYKLTTEQKIALEEKLYEKKQQLRNQEISALDKLGDAVVAALKNKYEQQKQLEEQRIDESIESWKKWEDSTVNAIQGQIDALDELKKTHEEENAREEYEHKRQDLELQKRYEKDDFNRKQIEKQIAALDKEENERLLNLEIEERKKVLQEQQEAVRKLSSDSQTKLENGRNDISERYDKYLNDFALQGEAKSFILNNSSSQTASLINEYASDYEMLGTSLGESLYQGISKKVDNIISYVDNIAAATDKESEKATASFELKNNTALVQRQANYLQKIIPSVSNAAQKIDSVINDFAAKIDSFSSGVSAYKQKLAVTADAAANKYYRTQKQYYNSTNTANSNSKTVNVYLTANFNDKVDSPVQVKRQLESFGYEIAKQI